MNDWALTRLVLHRQMVEDGVAPEQILKFAIRHNLSRSAIRANQQEDARQARDRGLITAKGTMELSGIDNTMHLDPNSEEYIRWVGLQTKNPMLMAYGTKGYEDVDWDTVAKFPAKAGPGSDSPADDSQAGPGKSSGSPDDNETDTPRSKRPV
jgi:hypothetical protein